MVDGDFFVWIVVLIKRSRLIRTRCASSRESRNSKTSAAIRTWRRCPSARKNRLRHLTDLATAAAENAGLWHQVAISRLGSGRWNSSGVGSGVNRIAAALRVRRFTGSASSAG